MKKFSIVLMFVLLSGLILSLGLQPVTAAEKHKYGGKLVITSKGAAYNFGVPTNQGGGGQHHFARMSLEQLVKADPKKPSSHIPWLAESWKLAPDRSYYDFHLKKGVKFHDGTDFNAQAVKFNHDMVVASKLPFLREIKSIEVIDNYTVRYNLSAWHSLVFTDFERPEQFILSPAAYEKQGEKELNNNPVGTGPWIVDRFKRNSFVFYKKNPNYWEKGLPYLDTIQILFIPDLMTQQASFLREEIDAAWQTDRIVARDLSKKGHKVDTFIGQNVCLSFDSTSPESPWYDKRMRMAMEYAVDKEKIARSLGAGFVDPSNSVIHHARDFGDPGVPIRKYDPEKARKLIAEAGYAKGIKGTLTYVNVMVKDFVLALQADLGEVGIELKLSPVTRVVSRDVLRSPHKLNELRLETLRYDPPNLLGAVRLDIVEATTYYPSTKRPDGFQERFQQAMEEADPEKQLKIVLGMEKLLYEDGMLIPLWNNPMFTVYHDYLHDVRWYPTGPFQEFQYAWLEEGHKRQ